MTTEQQSDARTIADRYRLRRRVGSGGSGEVWLADDLELDRQVAVKQVEIPRGLPDAERERARSRVLREARAAASIDHPHVVRVYDVLDRQDAVAIIMTYVDAPNLEEVVREHGPLRDGDAAVVGAQVLDALAAAHAQGVVHRDIKPSNVLLADDGAILTDFGIAAVTDGTNLTRTGTALGSPGYIAPEQASGAAVTTSADVWGLGATLYFAVEGRAPFDRGRAVATVHAVVHEEPDAAASGSDLLPLIHRLLEKDPEVRPALGDVRGQLGDRPAATTATDQLTRTQVLPTEVREIDASVRGGAPNTDARQYADGGRVVRGRGEHGGRERSGQRPSRGDRGHGGERSGKVVGTLISLVFLAVIAGLAWLWFATTGAERTSQSPATGDTAPAVAGEAEAPTTDTDSGQRAESRPAAPDATEQPTDAEVPQGQIPEGWERYDGPAYTVAHPAGWEVRQDSGPRIDLTDPETGTYLRIDYTDDPEPDPVADWEQASDAFAERYPDYEEISIDAVDYRDFEAALWEYSYRTDGQRFHAYNLGFTDAECGYALNLQAPASLWSEIEPRFEDFMASFEPEGC